MNSLPIQPSEFKDWSKRAYVYAYNIFRSRLDRSEKYELQDRANDVAVDAWLKLLEKEEYRTLSTENLRKIYFVTVRRLARDEADKIKRRKTVPRSSFMIGEDNSDDIDFFSAKMKYVNRHFSRQDDLLFYEEIFEKLLAIFDDPEERAIAEIDLRSEAEGREEKFMLYKSQYLQIEDEVEDGKWYFFKRLVAVRKKARHQLIKMLQDKK